MLDLPALAIGAILVIIAAGVLSMLHALASQIRNEIALHTLQVRVTTYRNHQLVDRGHVVIDVDEFGVVDGETEGEAPSEDRAAA
ncbi:MAG: hypothetical protein RBS39_03780 [Phycisphaerales bacterium]|jgi:hypothetical protein|nr:hypothetical protein [Phycisphaerales bacterium]